MGLEWYLSPYLSLIFSLSVSHFVFQEQHSFCFSTSKTSTDMVYEPNTVSIYKRVRGQKQQHLAISLKQQSAKKETIPKLQPRYEGIQK